MKIYQIHEYGGEWCDSYDDIISSYISEDKAKEELNRLKQEEEYYRKLIDKCNGCPLRHYIKSNISVEQYCDKYEPFDINKHNTEYYDENDKCINYHWHHDDCLYRIEEVEVIE